MLNFFKKIFKSNSDTETSNDSIKQSSHSDVAKSEQEPLTPDSVLSLENESKENKETSHSEEQELLAPDLVLSPENESEENQETSHSEESVLSDLSSDESPEKTVVDTVSEDVSQDKDVTIQTHSWASPQVSHHTEPAVQKKSANDNWADGQSKTHSVDKTLGQENQGHSWAHGIAVDPIDEQPRGEKENMVGWAARLKRGLTKSRDHMAKSLASVLGGGQIDEDLYEELETVLITSDMGIEATDVLMKEVRNRVSLKGLKDGGQLRQALKEALYDLLKPLEKPLVIPNQNQPFVIMVAGINGAGKTTSIGKLAKYFQAHGKSVILAAGDTFRAAAREQLQEWGARNHVTVISQASGDSAAVCYDAVEAAKARKIDIVLADTAGRLPTQLHLMEEIKKVKRVLQKSMPDAPHEIMVVLDANIGQNAINQVVAFDDALGVTGLIVTKLDGSAKGGILAALASHRAIPVRYIGVGEGIDDLRPFNARIFVDALIDE